VRKGWEVKRLAELCAFENGDRGKNYPSKRFQISEGIPFINAGHLDNNVLNFEGMNYISVERFKMLSNGKTQQGDIIFCLRGSLGKFASVGNLPAGAIASSLVIVRPDKNLLPKYLMFYFESYLCKQMIEKFANGAAQPNLSAKNLGEFTIPLPPLSEQKQIVSILDEAFEGIAKAKANAEKNLANAREIFESYLQDLFVNKKSGWKEAKLNDLCEKITKGSSPKWQGIKYVGEPGILFVTSENVGVNRMILNTKKYVEERFNLLEKKAILKRGDVLTNIVGASIGRTAIFECDDIANINQAVCILRCKTDLLYNRFLSYLLNSPFLKAHLHENEVNNARANLSLGFFSNLKLNIPTLKEQKTIVSRIDEFAESIEKLETVYLRKLNDLQDLKKSILQKAFSGDLIRRAS
jgi:type I restriction enzyme S subunit